MQHNQQINTEASQQESSSLRTSLNSGFKSLNAQKKEFENLWKFIYLGLSIFSAFLIKKVYLFHTEQEFENFRKGTVQDILLIALPISIVYTIFDLFIHYCFDDFCLKHCLTEQRYEGAARPKRAYTLVKWGYSIFYYLISSVSAYVLLKDTSFFPTWLGGTGSPHNVFNDLPDFTEATNAMKIFYMVQFGKHFSRFFGHMFIRSEGNYYEYILHHALSNFLILFSFLTNMWLIGIMVLLCHDLSDFGLTICRGYKDTKFCYKPLLQFFYVFGFSGWVVTRLIIFPLTCVYPAIVNLNVISANIQGMGEQIMKICCASMAFMMALLLGLQVFWTYYIIQSFMSVNITSKVTHNYD